MKKWILLVICSIAFSAYAAEKVKVSAEQTQVYDDIKQTLGMVPTFMKEYPAEGIAGAWEEFKGIQLSPNTALDGKTKELIGLAVSSQIPCRYCIYFHKKALAFHGAKPEDIRLAIAIAGFTRKWSANLYGNLYDAEVFRKDIDRMVAATAKMPQQTEVKEPVQVTDAQSAYKEIEKTFGFVPAFLRNYPEAGIAGAWKNFRDMNANPNTSLSPKTKDLISLAVSSQIPCDYCTYADTRFATANGASPQEIKEAVALAGIVRNWSTVLNGVRQDEKAFENEVNQIFKYLDKSKAMPPKKVSQSK
ncbi:carboxymuconolactone decarboxylase family protein [Bdellovibrio reynosensis]|uniref:Carboxymuconolactone decarboxylase family protein n=1 Tax=Bdellovibrio reynosensis TaxID=2835041 RepID=A0ABY4C4P3_9BACT|nr:carboxymuconolactone decarboxylase family protein [Bdellovibrio reynosensis]UOE99822.1 carboxymuconolactone decarboxylase family protein [Bdellovibrio reynosensis]